MQQNILCKTKRVIISALLFIVFFTSQAQTSKTEILWDTYGVPHVKDQHLKILTLYNQILEEVNNLMNLYMSFSAQKTNDVMKVLTIFSVFFMPLTFIVGIYGMNFEFMPELKQKWGYPVILIVMAIVTGVIYQWFRRKKWL